MIIKLRTLNSKKFNSSKLKKLKNAMNDAILKISKLKSTMKKFIRMIKHTLRQKNDNLNIKKGIKEIISRASFISMYNKMYDFFMQKEKDFSQRMQQIKNNIYKAIYDEP